MRLALLPNRTSTRQPTTAPGRVDYLSPPHLALTEDHVTILEAAEAATIAENLVNHLLGPEAGR